MILGPGNATTTTTAADFTHSFCRFVKTTMIQLMVAISQRMKSKRKTIQHISSKCHFGSKVEHI